MKFIKSLISDYSGPISVVIDKTCLVNSELMSDLYFNTKSYKYLIMLDSSEIFNFDGLRNSNVFITSFNPVNLLCNCAKAVSIIGKNS